MSDYYSTHLLPQGRWFRELAFQAGMDYMVFASSGRYTLPDDWDPSYHLQRDGEWDQVTICGFATLREPSEFNDYTVPVFPTSG